MHQLLAQSAEYQRGDLPIDARVEMLIMQWMLARPEMRVPRYRQAGFL
jgi:hypothetical protein